MFTGPLVPFTQVSIAFHVLLLYWNAGSIILTFQLMLWTLSVTFMGYLLWRKGSWLADFFLPWVADSSDNLRKLNTRLRWAFYGSLFLTVPQSMFYLILTLDYFGVFKLGLEEGAAEFANLSFYESPAGYAMSIYVTFVLMMWLLLFMSIVVLSLLACMEHMQKVLDSVEGSPWWQTETSIQHVLQIHR